MNAPSLPGCETVVVGANHVRNFYNEDIDVQDEHCFGWAFVNEDGCQGLIGSFTLPNGMEWASITLKDGSSFRPIWYRHVVELFRVFRESGFERTVCHCDDDIPGAEKLLLRLGFREIEEPSPVELELSCGKRLFEWLV